ncbi:MAG: hypothetical protein R3E95_07285 [Thiolinea sp.]
MKNNTLLLLVSLALVACNDADTETLSVAGPSSVQQKHSSGATPTVPLLAESLDAFPAAIAAATEGHVLMKGERC